MKIKDYGASLEIGYDIDGQNKVVCYSLMGSQDRNLDVESAAKIVYSSFKWMGFRVIVCMHRKEKSAIWVYSWPTHNHLQTCVASEMKHEVFVKGSTAKEWAYSLLSASQDAAQALRKDPSRVERILAQAEASYGVTRSSSRDTNQECRDDSTKNMIANVQSENPLLSVL